MQEYNVHFTNDAGLTSYVIFYASSDIEVREKLIQLGARAHIKRITLATEDE